MRFKDMHVIITGGGTGIGRATALQFGREGARVVVANRNRENGERVAEEITRAGGQAIYLPVDVADTTSIQRMVAEAVKTNGPVHVAVSNAGVAESKASALENTEEDWDYAYNINARGSFMSAVISHTGIPFSRWIAFFRSIIPVAEGRQLIFECKITPSRL